MNVFSDPKHDAAPRPRCHAFACGPWPSTVLALVASLLMGTGQRGAGADEGWFREKIQPILEQRCLPCHSHASGKMHGGLALDSRSGWSEGGDSGPAIVPGQPDRSLLIEAVRRAGLEMPPEEPLPAAEVELLVEWVRRGAPDPRVLSNASSPIADTQWWSLLPLERHPLPEVTARAAAVAPLDTFLLERLEQRRLSFSPPASRRDLLRRLMYDLHGLPPTREELDEFERDADPSAYERWVDRLLASPRLGERWARHWFDSIHFAETHGYEHDVYRGNAWRYRDYVIDAFNHDKPWPRFVHEQLAADAFYPDEPQHTPALGFLGAGTFDQSTFSTAPVTFDYLDRDDMVTQVMAALASTTANCARCHDHKFDPVTQEDYYSLQAVFAGIWKGDLVYDSDPQVLERRRYWQGLLAAAEQRDAERLGYPDARGLSEAWERESAVHVTAWKTLEVLSMVSSDGTQLRPESDGVIAAEGPRPERDTYTITARIPLPTLTAVRLDVLSDMSLPMKGPGRQDNGNLHLSEIEILASDTVGAAPRPLKIRRATSDWDQQGWTIQHAIDGNTATAWGIYPRVGESHLAVFELDTPLSVTPTTTLTIVLKQLHGQGHLIGRFQLTATSLADAKADAVPADVTAALSVPVEQRTAAQSLTLAAHAIRSRAQRELSELPPPARVYAAGAAVERDNNVARIAEPKVVHVLKRGDIQKPGNIARPGALSMLASLPGRFDLADPRSESARRVALAAWLTHPRNPLSWRSIVNRIWHYHFGRGICDTPNDFGRMGGTPSHPELLDWLTLEFRDGEQSLKALHRQLVTSAAYRQTSNASAGAGPSLAADPENHLLGRMLRQRLDAESYRDAVLAVSGRLDLSLGGPSIQHFQTSPGQQLTPKLNYDAYTWEGPGAGRRSIYRFVWRGIADPFMEALDFPDMALLQPHRGYSASALQALTLYNNQFVLRHSEHFARRAELAGGTLSERARAAAEAAWLRPIEANEARVLSDYAERHGLAALCRVLLNSNEFLFVE